MNRRIVPAALLLSCHLIGLGCPTLSSAAQAASHADTANPASQAESGQKSTTCRVGLKSIAVPAPANLVETGSDYRVLFEHDAPDTNRLVAAFLQAEEIAKLPQKSESGLQRYAFLETLREAEFMDVDEATYKQIEDAVAKQFGTSADAPPVDMKALQDEVNHKAKAEGRTGDVSFDKPVMLGTLFSKPGALGVGMMMTLGAGDKSKKVILVTTVLRVQNRLLYAAVFALYTGDESTTWARTVSERWADAILKANP